MLPAVSCPRSRDISSGRRHNCAGDSCRLNARLLGQSRAGLRRNRDLPSLCVLFVFAFLTSIAMACFARLRLRGRNWRYWSFLAIKMAFVIAMASLLWIEVGFSVRRQIANDTARIL